MLAVNKIVVYEMYYLSLWQNVNWVLCVVHTAILISNNCDDPNKQWLCIVDEYVDLEYAVQINAVSLTRFT